MEQGENGHPRRWALVFVLGILLHAYAAFHSDLGLDSHVRLNALNDDSSNGQELSWGSPRISSSSNVNSSTVYDGYILPWNTSEAAMKITAITSLALVAVVVSFRPRDQSSTVRFEPLWGALLMMSPALMFSTSRGYDEAPLALLTGLGVLGFWFNRSESIGHLRLNGVLMATSVSLVMLWKGFSPVSSLVIWLVMTLLTEAWARMHRSGSYTAENQFFGNPWSVGFLTFILVYVGVILFGFISSTGTFAIIGERPVHFFIASVFAAFDAVVLYLLLGCLLWPFVVNRWKRLRSARGPGLTMLVVYICALLSGIIAYIATLWTLEASLWNMSLVNVMVVLGNNGRYATLLLIPVAALLRWGDLAENHGLQRETHHSFRAIVFVLPLLLFTTLVGHQIWSEDAGELLLQSWDEDDDTVLLIAPESMAIHHLYVLKTNLDLDGSAGVQGLWVSPGDAQNFIGTHGASIDYVLIAPETTLDADLSSWRLLESREVPVSVPGGIQGGAWSLYRLSA